ncbi:integrase zinc binding domain-containing protein, partial [Klebsiella variicola]|uniref:integrase zinc binding domain-containing protein n=1 Tax=Klebsiella variicola TaxID=244366 RepID=UPI0039C26234
MNQGILYRYDPDSISEDAQLVVPKHWVSHVLKSYHDDEIAGHGGVERTYYRISSRYHWPKMRASIADYIKHYVEC